MYRRIHIAAMTTYNLNEAAASALSGTHQRPAHADFMAQETDDESYDSWLFSNFFFPKYVASDQLQQQVGKQNVLAYALHEIRLRYESLNTKPH